MQYIYIYVFFTANPFLSHQDPYTLPVCLSFFCIAGNFHKDATGPQMSISFTYDVCSSFFTIHLRSMPRSKEESLKMNYSNAPLKQKLVKQSK